MKIRGYLPKDHDAVRFVCLNSEGPCDWDMDTRRFVLTTYCDYYIECEGENCFVLADDRDDAVGYIICTADFDRFFPVFRDRYAARFDDAKARASSLASVDPQRKFKAAYPAHMHIDILPEYQRQGYGHRLVDTLAAHLKQKGIPGVMLTVGTLNKTGQAFYEKYGFTLLEQLEGDLAYGLPLTQEEEKA